MNYDLDELLETRLDSVDEVRFFSVMTYDTPLLHYYS